MIDVKTLFLKMVKEGTFQKAVRDPRVQFGPAEQPLLGATLLPERGVPENFVKESEIRFRSNIALDGTRYSPVQRKEGGIYFARFFAELGHSDIGGEFDAESYDNLIQLLSNNLSMSAEATLIRWFDNIISLPLRWKVELQRWQALLDRSVVRQGQGISETITYPSPSGNHVSLAATPWTDNSVDPMEWYLAKKRAAATKGYKFNRHIGSNAIMTILQNNQKMVQRANGITVLPSGASTQFNFVTPEQINGVFKANGIPPMEEYESHYQTTTGSQRFFPETTVMLVATTGRTEAVDLGPDENQKIIPDTVGYVGVGKPAGQVQSGRLAIVTLYDQIYPPKIDAQGVQETLPVITEPDAIYTGYGIA